MSTNLSMALTELERERTSLKSQLERISNAITVLNVGTKPRAIGTMSAAGRARIAAAQRARWAKVKATQTGGTVSRKKRKLSPAALARIRAAQKARWAKWRKGKKAA